MAQFKPKCLALTDRNHWHNLIRYIHLKADIFISLHCNHSDNPNARGIEIYVANAISKYSDESTWLPFLIQVELNNNLGFESRGVKFGNFQVLREIMGYCTSILLELGFLSNMDECRYYRKTESIKALALTILGKFY